MRKAISCALAVLALMLLPSMMRAETIDVQYLVLVHEDGTEVKFALTDGPVITFNDENELVVTCNGQDVVFGVQSLVSHEIITEQVEKPSTSGIQNIPVAETPKPVVAFGQAAFSGLKDGQQVTVYTIDGKVVTTVRANADGKVAVDLSALPKGLYILRAPNYSYKISTK